MNCRLDRKTESLPIILDEKVVVQFEFAQGEPRGASLVGSEVPSVPRVRDRASANSADICVWRPYFRLRVKIGMRHAFKP